LSEKRVWVFFYGLYMDLQILKENNVVPEKFEAAQLSGYDFQVSSWGYLVPSERHSVFGILEF
jgi:hypothetical protein